jgi:hypothetical protein
MVRSGSLASGWQPDGPSPPLEFVRDSSRVGTPCPCVTLRHAGITTARPARVDAAVWTALPARFAGVGDRAKAEEYVRRIPDDIRTLYRGLIEERLGWTPRA